MVQIYFDCPPCASKTGTKGKWYKFTLHKKMFTRFSEFDEFVPLPSGCPMTTTRGGRRYLATVNKGEATSLQGDKSEVKLEISKGCPKRAFLMEVRTDLNNFKSIIPEDKLHYPKL